MADRVNEVQIADARVNELGEAVLKEFGLRCGQLMQRIVDQREDPSDNDESAIEVEARVGTYDESKRQFVPGVAQKFFRGMREYLEKKVRQKNWYCADDRTKLVEFTHTDLVDVQFEDGVRVSCQVEKEQGSNHVTDVIIHEVITKRKLGRAQDFIVNSPVHGTRHHLRLGVACEEQIPSHSNQYTSHVNSAKKAIFDAFNVSTRLKILGGIEVTLNKDVEFVYIRFPPISELAARGRLGFSDPIYSEFPDGKLHGAVARQLKWTLLQPSRLPSLGSHPNPELRPNKNDLDSTLLLTNLPGSLVLPDGSNYGVFACQYVIEVRRDHILCGHGRFANVGNAPNPNATEDGEDDPDAPKPPTLQHENDTPEIPIKIFRRKRRWSFLLRRNQRLDLTETQQSTNLVTLSHETPVFEVELEKLLSSVGCREEKPENLAIDLKAVYHTDAFLQDIASRIYGYALPPLNLDDPPNEIWAKAREEDKTRKDRLLLEIQRVSMTEPKSALDRSHGPSADSTTRRPDEEFADQIGAADFYNQLDRSSQAARHHSLIYHMRCLNNFVKSVVLNETVRQVLAYSDRGAGINILDLACGKGADIPKFIRSCKELKTHIGTYVGVDIARKSLQDAVDRLSGLRDNPKPRHVHFIEADLGMHSLSSRSGDEEDIKNLEQWSSSNPSWHRRPPSETLPLDFKFHVVSMQFALHYMFQNIKRAHHFFRMLSRHMAINGRFIATTVHADEMIRRVMAAGPDKSSFSIFDEFGTETCSVEFEPDFRKKAFTKYSKDDSEADSHLYDDMVGIRYNFTLRDGDDDSQQAVAAPEWLVPPHLLVKLATAYSFELKRFERLPNAAVRHMPQDAQNMLFRRMNVLNHKGTVSQAEWDIASLYVIIELEKIPKPTSPIEALRRLKHTVRNFSDLPEDERNELLNILQSGDS